MAGRAVKRQGGNEGEEDRFAGLACTSSPSSADSLDFPLRFRACRSFLSLSRSFALCFSLFLGYTTLGSLVPPRMFPVYNLFFYGLKAGGNCYAVTSIGCRSLFLSDTDICFSCIYSYWLESCFLEIQETRLGF